MKKVILACILFIMLAPLKSQAQSDTLFSDSTINFSFKQIADSVFRHVDLSQVTTGLLIEKAFSTVDVSLFNGQINDSSIADIYSWRRAYGTLQRANIDTTLAKDTSSLNVISDTIRSYLDSGLVPVAILNYQYGRIKANAFDDHLLSMTGIEVFDVENREENPYETHTCFIASAGTNRVDSPKVEFVFPSSLYVTNDTREIDHIEADFGNGQGWQTVHFDEPILIDYDSAQSIQMKVRVFMDDNEELLSYYPITIGDGVYLFGEDNFTGPGGQQYDEYYFFEADRAFEETTGGAYVSIHYACSNTDKKLRRPFIVAGGFHGPEGLYGTPTFKRPVHGRGFFIDIFSNNESTFWKIISQEYDLVFVDFFKPTDYIQANAYVLQKIIKWVNDEKRANGSIAQNIVFGNSMGGIVARFALGDMHQDYEDRKTKLP
jgi:hypothetical protein